MGSSNVRFFHSRTQSRTALCSLRRSLAVSITRISRNLFQLRSRTPLLGGFDNVRDFLVPAYLLLVPPGEAKERLKRRHGSPAAVEAEDELVGRLASARR
jgi:hypothetical protein